MPCTVRFFYCYVSPGSGTSFDLMVSPKNQWKMYRIWSAPTDFPPSKNKTKCQWTRVSVEIPAQDEPYKLQFIADSYYHKSLKIAIDDISMSPNCFKYVLNETTTETPKIWNLTKSTANPEIQDAIPSVSQSSYLYNYLKKGSKECDLLKSQIDLRSLKAGQPVNVSKNLIYESLGLTAELINIPRKNIIFKNALGQGAFGEVFEGTLTTDGRKIPVAIKCLPTTTSKDAIDDFEMEALIMSLKGVCFEQSPRLIVLELLAGGDLKTFLRNFRLNKKSTEDLKMSDLFKMAIDVAKGCKYLSDNRFIHRDIAARNCLLSKRSKGRVVKIADFGMARDIYRQEYYRKGGKSMLPIKWMPPEAFLEGIFTLKTDVWSYGVLLWELFSLGYVPYPGRNNHEVMTLVVEGSRLGPPSGVPTEIYDLMMECWKTVDTQRPDFTYILNKLESIMKNSAVTSASAFNCLCINNEPKLMLENNADEMVETKQLIASSNARDEASTMSTKLCSEGTTAVISDYGVSLNVCEPFASTIFRPLSTAAYQNSTSTLSKRSSDLLIRSNLNDHLNGALQISLVA
uniref:Tyrosine-protein kinase receptor n=1 Tax=Syphacia muris TaxID=451379 RepID=A0A0N5AH48_9BILA